MDQMLLSEIVNKAITILEINSSSFPDNDYVKPDEAKHLAVILYSENYELLEANLWLETREDLDELLIEFDLKRSNLQRLASQNKADAQYDLSLLNYHGGIFPKDLKKSFKYCQMSALEGNANAQFQLARLYQRGEGVKSDLEKTIKYCELAAKQNHPRALYVMGSHYFSGEIIEKNEIKALDYWKKGADLGEKNCQYNVGFAYYHGDLREKNLELAHYYFAKAAEQGEAKAQYQIATAYLLGEYFKKDIPSAIAWYSSAAEKGEPSAQEALGFIYAGREFVDVDISKAKHYLTLAAKQGSSLASDALKEISDALNEKSYDNQTLTILPNTNDGRGLQSLLQSFRLAQRADRDEFLRRIGASKEPESIFSTPLETLLRIDENQQIEFKETFSLPTKTPVGENIVTQDQIRFASIKEIAGFLNSNDGVLLIGVVDGKNTESQKPEIAGIEKDKFDGNLLKYADNINDVVASALGKAAVSNLKINFEKVNGATVCRINVTKSTTPVFCNFKKLAEDVAFIRHHSATSKASAREWTDWINEKF